jgi:ribosome silencing factor RsfS/YbeB/iojap
MHSAATIVNQTRAQFAKLASTSERKKKSASSTRASFFTSSNNASSFTTRSARNAFRFPNATTTAAFPAGKKKQKNTKRTTLTMTRAAATAPIPGLSSMKKADLVKCCEERGLESSGTVPVLRQRLRDAVSTPTPEEEEEEEETSKESGETVVTDGSSNAYVKQSFSIKDEADDEEQDAIARKLALELAVEADNTRAKDIRVLQVSKAVFYARYVVLATAFNRPQMSAVTSKMRDVANNETYNLQVPKNVANQGDWTCLDCRDVIAHVFTPTARTYYDLEDLYQECDEVELPFETERMHDGFYAEEDQEFYENEDEDESEDLEDEFEINWSEK